VWVALEGIEERHLAQAHSNWAAARKIAISSKLDEYSFTGTS